MILHVDMDAFYASVEERDRPELRGKPIIVGGRADQRGVVAAANYVVRQFGVHSAMATATATRLCPYAIIVPPRMGLYASISSEIRDIFHRYTPLVEPLAFDEAFLDVRGSLKLFGSTESIGRRIKSEILEELSLVASVGVAPNKFLAKLASDLDKPDGFVVVHEGDEQKFLDPLAVERVWGVGKVAAESLRKLGVRTIRQLRHLSPEVIDQQFGKHGEHLWRLAHGIDNRSVVPDREAKSISHETTFARDITAFDSLCACLMQLTDQVARRLRNNQLRGRTVQLKIRYSDFQTFTCSHSLSEPSHSTDELWQAVSYMLSNRLPDRELRVRLLGMGVTGIDGTGISQAMLFDRESTQRNERLDHVTDEIKDRFGDGSIKRGTSTDRTSGR